MAASHDSETPAHGQQVLTVCGFIHAELDGKQKVFLAKRAKTKKFFPDTFELLGGHVDFGETMINGLKREVLEEIDMDIEVGDPFYVFTYANDIKGSHSIEVVYFARFTSPIENIKLDPEDHSEFKWASEDEIESIFVSDSKTLEDEEVKAIQKGFAILRGEKLNML